MKRVQGNSDVALLECTNPVRNKWRVRWDVTADDSGAASYMEEEFNHKPSGEEIKSLISGWINARTDEHILSGFRYNGKTVWLSTENQFNYKAAYDLAVQTAGASLPVTFKLGDDDSPEYVTFQELTALSSFYTGAMKFIQDTLAQGWKAKDSIDLALYTAN